jgi:hypothetical protein
VIENADLESVAEARVLAGAVLATASAQRNANESGLDFLVSDRDVLRGIDRRDRLRFLAAIVAGRRCRVAGDAHIDALIGLDVDLVAEGAQDVTAFDDNLPGFVGWNHAGAAHHTPSMEESVVPSHFRAEVLLFEGHVVGRDKLACIVTRALIDDRLGRVADAITGCSC